jgi:hypothetical protein
MEQIKKFISEHKTELILVAITGVIIYYYYTKKKEVIEV